MKTLGLFYRSIQFQVVLRKQINFLLKIFSLEKCVCLSQFFSIFSTIFNGTQVESNNFGFSSLNIPFNNSTQNQQFYISIVTKPFITCFIALRLTILAPPPLIPKHLIFVSNFYWPNFHNSIFVGE